MGKNPIRITFNESKRQYKINEVGKITEVAEDEKINYIFSATMTDLYKYYVVGDTVNGYELKNDGKDCISIESKEEMEYLSKYTNANYVTENVTFVLINDIDLNPGVTIGTDGTITGGTPEEWISIGTGNPFKGILDGCNYSIVGLYSNDTSKANSGLFGVIDGATIQNLIVSNSYLAGKESGIVVDKSIGNGVLLKNIISKENYIFCKGGKVGGIIGCEMSNNSTLENINSNNIMFFESYTVAAGIVAEVNGDICNINNCSNYTDIIYEEDGCLMSGIVALVIGENVYINNCYNYGKIIGQSENAGIVAEGIGTNITITNCHNTGDIRGNWASGGIIGYDKSNKMNINNCYNLGKIYSAKIESGEFGGIIGQENTDDFLMYNCYNFGEIYASEEKYVFGNIGGLIGYAGSSRGLIKISNCYSNCDVILSYPEGKSVERTVYFGDLIGVVFGNVTIENLYGKTNKNTELLPENACQFGKYIGALEANYKGEYTGTKLITGYQSATDIYPPVYLGREYVTQNLRQVDNYASQEFCDMLNEWVGENSQYSKWIYDANKNGGLPYLEVLKDTVK